MLRRDGPPPLENELYASRVSGLWLVRLFIRNDTPPVLIRNCTLCGGGGCHFQSPPCHERFKPEDPPRTLFRSVPMPPPLDFPRRFLRLSEFIIFYRLPYHFIFMRSTTPFLFSSQRGLRLVFNLFLLTGYESVSSILGGQSSMTSRFPHNCSFFRAASSPLFFFWSSKITFVSPALLINLSICCFFFVLVYFGPPD